MSRKATITQKEIVNAAFKITKKEGFEQITSRKLAAAAGCSTQPIFRIYENMDALKQDVYEKAADLFIYGSRHRILNRRNDNLSVPAGTNLQQHSYRALCRRQGSSGDVRTHQCLSSGNFGF